MICRAAPHHRPHHQHKAVRQLSEGVCYIIVHGLHYYNYRPLLSSLPGQTG